MIEVLIVIALIGVLLAITTVFIDPPRQFAKARNTQREAHINIILTAIGQNITDHNGVFDCVSGAIPTTTKVIGTSGYNIKDCIVPIYTAELSMDPVTGTSTDTGYSIEQNATTTRITITADDAELEQTISITR